MKNLLDLACTRAQQAEIWQTASHCREIAFEEGKLVRVETSLHEGVSLRVIKDGKFGSAYTTNLRDPGELVEQAVRSATFGAQAPAGDLPPTRLPVFRDPGFVSIEALEIGQIAGEAERYLEAASRLTKGTINVSAQALTRRTRLLNSSGADVTSEQSSWDFVPRILFDGTCSGVGERVLSSRFEPFSRESLEFACDLHRASAHTATVGSGPMPVLVMPEAAFMIIWRLMSAGDASCLYQKMSPFDGKTGRKIFSDLITFGDDPRDTVHPAGQPFDDEGMPAEPLTIIDKGVFREFFTDRLHAQKLGIKPNGRCFRGAGLFGSDRLSGSPRPHLQQPTIAAGATPLRELLTAVDSALVVFEILGGHSGNIPNGDFSVGIASGFLVEKGRVAGRVKDLMLTGNIHDLLGKVIAVGDTVGASMCGFAPPILFDRVQVAASA